MNKTAIWQVQLIKEYNQYYVFNNFGLPVMPITEYLDFRGLRGNSAKTDAQHLKDFFEFLSHKDLDFKNFTTKHIPEYHGWINTPKEQRGVGMLFHVDASIKNSTWNKKFGALRSFYENYIFVVFSETKKHLSFGDFETKTRGGYTKSTRSVFSSKTAKTPVSQKYIPREHMLNILNCSQERDKLIFLLLTETGMRIGELLSLDKKIFSTIPRKTDFGLFEFEIEESDSEDTRRQTKSGYRPVSCTVELAIRISTYILRKRAENRKDHKYIFTTEKDGRSSKIGDPLSYQAVRNNFDSICKKLDYQYTLHDMRHTFVTDMLLSGAGLIEVQEAAGHKSVMTTKGYDRRTDSDFIKQVAPAKLELFRGIYEQI